MKISKIKADIRKNIRQQRVDLSAAERELFSCKLVQNVLSWEIYKRAGAVMIYYPMSGEIDLLELTRTSGGKRFFMPITGENFTMTVGEYSGGGLIRGLIRGSHGIWEPQESSHDADIDLVLAPAVACDRLGTRLGQGGGYYDRFLRRMKESGKSGKNVVFAATVYDFQMMDILPAEPHDMKMDYVVTPSGIFSPQMMKHETR
ncbi:MAG: 5-formyltetrahydrofolate cyclo-ligase [Christensenellales bacterium]|jgi:5-formyltetrahydrofolate cyclo-ligase